MKFIKKYVIHSVTMAIVGLLLMGCAQDHVQPLDSSHQAHETSMKSSKTHQDAPPDRRSSGTQVKGNKTASTVNLTIIGYQKKMILPSTSVPVRAKDTCFTLLQRALRAKDIPISVQGGGATAYVVGIANQFALDHGPNSGWLVEKNGKMLTRGVGVTSVQPGDRIVWKYTADYTSDGE